MARYTDHLGRPLIAVTGMGVVTSLGAGKKENWAKLTSGTSGIHAITRFPTDHLKTTIAGTIESTRIPVISASMRRLRYRVAT